MSVIDLLKEMTNYPAPYQEAMAKDPMFWVKFVRRHKTGIIDALFLDKDYDIKEEEINYHYDMNNIFVLGSSMGAFGAWNYLMERPDLFRGMVSASGGISIPVKENLEIINRALEMAVNEN